ncbi:hypothetical protein PAPYR_13056 [Paratrimastix pyriformis]|uniref:Helicase ATP-binding domain-containing protein n=1 Tax=Paratrimastix pyriformis TaxID=342808 RepID=A0ABQ8U3B4_9EUKA|nr:hypothetical protein PAPYR_13056 [Paratrimastix pyriformis]
MLFDAKKVVTKNSKVQKKPVRHECEYDCNNDQVVSLLRVLPKEYVDDTTYWFKVTSSLKSADKFEIWDKWSRNSSKYDKIQNIDIWNSINPIVDINYLVNLVNDSLGKKAFQLFNPFVKYIPLKEELPCEKDNIDEHYIDIPSGYATYIIESDQGTGKTTAVSKKVKLLLDKRPELKFLSIVSRVSLINQQVETFGASGTMLNRYDSGKLVNIHSEGDDEIKEEVSLIDVNNVAIQLDSIIRLDRENYFDTIVFIDEINSLLRYLVSSTTLSERRKIVYSILRKIVSECKYLFCVDADITDLIQWITGLRNKEKTIFIQNEYKNWTTSNAYKVNDEKLLIEKMKENIENDKYFVACFDSKNTAQQYYVSMMNDDKKDKFELITCDDGEIPEHANNWKNKFIFYSPKIVYGLSFVPEEPQDVFLIVSSACMTIDPLSAVQQITRTRKIANLYYFIKRVRYGITDHTLDGIKNSITCDIKQNYDTLDQFGAIDIENYGSINETKFLDMYFKVEYYDMVFKTNYERHFKDLLIKKGFIIMPEIGNYCNIGSDVKKQMNKDKEEFLDERIEKHFKMDENKKLEESGIDNIVEHIKHRMEIVGVDEKDYEKYSKYVKTEGQCNRYISTCRICEKKSDKIGQCKIKQGKDFSVNNLYCNQNKILYISKLEDALGIGSFDIENVHNLDENVKLFDKVPKDVKGFSDLTTVTLGEIRKIFRIKPATITKRSDILGLLVKCYKNVCSKGLINSIKKRKRVDGKIKIEKTRYSINQEVLKEHLQLYYNKNNSDDNIQKHLRKLIEHKETE